MHYVSLRLANRVQLTTDGHHAYLDAVDNAFQLQDDFAQLVKLYGAPTGTSQTERKYSPNYNKNKGHNLYFRFNNIFRWKNQRTLFMYNKKKNNTITIPNDEIEKIIYKTKLYE